MPPDDDDDDDDDISCKLHKFQQNVQPGFYDIEV